MRIGEAAAVRLVALTDAADAAAQNNLGVVLQRGGRADDAARAFGRAIALDAGMSVARRNLRALPASTLAAAVDARWARVRADATDPDAWRALVRHYAARGEFEAAAGVIDRWEAATVDRAPATLERARCALDAGDPVAALEAVERLRHSSGVGPELAASLDLLEARAAYQRGDPARALAAVDRARGAAPQDADVELLRSFVLGELGATDAAAASRARAGRLDPSTARVDPGVLSDAGHDDAFGSPRDVAPVVARDGRAAPDPEFALAAALRQKGYLREAAHALAPATASGDPTRRGAALAAAGVLQLLRGDGAGAVASLGAAVDVTSDGADRGAVLLALGAAQLFTGDLAAAADAAARVLDRGTAPLARAGAANVRALAAWRRDDLASAHADLLGAAGEARRLGGAQADAVRAVLAANLALLLSAVAAPAAVAAGAAAVRLAPHDHAAHAAHARALSQAGDHVGARDAFARACALVPRDAASRYGLAFAAGACGDRAASRLELARAAALSSVVRGPVPRVVLDADGALFLAGDGAGAAAVGTPLVHGAGEAEASTDGACYAHVDARLVAGDYDRALAAADLALARGASAAGGHVRAGHALARGGRGALALARYEQAADADPADLALEMHVLRTLYGLGRYAEACARAAGSLTRWPDSAAITGLLARAAADHGDAETAVDALDRCARTSRGGTAADDAAFWADVACAWQALGAWDAASAAWAEASRAVPTVPSSALAHARALARAGHADRADALLQELGQASPGLADVWRARAELALSTGHLPAARAHLARVVGVDARDADALATLAAASVDAGRFDEAALAVDRALGADGDHPLALAVRGDCAAAAGDDGAAREYWGRSLAAAPVGAGAVRARRGLRDACAHANAGPGARATGVAA